MLSSIPMLKNRQQIKDKVLSNYFAKNPGVFDKSVDAIISNTKISEFDAITKYIKIHPEIKLDELFAIIKHVQKQINENNNDATPEFFNVSPHENKITDGDVNVPEFIERHAELIESIETICLHRNNLFFKKSKNLIKYYFGCCTSSEQFGSKGQFSLLDTVYTETAEKLIKKISEIIEPLNDDTQIHTAETEKPLHKHKKNRSSSYPTSRKTSNPVVTFQPEATQSIIDNKTVPYRPRTASDQIFTQHENPKFIMGIVNKENFEEKFLFFQKYIYSNVKNPNLQEISLTYLAMAADISQEQANRLSIFYEKWWTLCLKNGAEK